MRSSAFLHDLEIANLGQITQDVNQRQAVHDRAICATRKSVLRPWISLSSGSPRPQLQGLAIQHADIAGAVADEGKVAVARCVTTISPASPPRQRHALLHRRSRR